MWVILFYIFCFQHGNTALHEAAWKGYSRTVELLCKNRSNYYLRNRGGFSALHLCCQGSILQNSISAVQFWGQNFLTI
jgi:hypothetical protein